MLGEAKESSFLTTAKSWLQNILAHVLHLTIGNQIAYIIFSYVLHTIRYNFRTHFLRVGTAVNDTLVSMIQFDNLRTTFVTNVPLFIPGPETSPFCCYSPHRKTCSITFNKAAEKTLTVLAKHHEKTGVVLHEYNLAQDTWAFRRATNIQYFGES